MGKGRNDEGEVKLHMKAYTDINIRPSWIWRIYILVGNSDKRVFYVIATFPSLQSTTRAHREDTFCPEAGGSKFPRNLGIYVPK